jgi:Winged helix-turn helix
MPVRTVGEYLKRWGSTAKRPRRHAQDQDRQYYGHADHQGGRHTHEASQAKL